jgi:hypothetical protein
MPICEVVKKNGCICNKQAMHIYNKRPLCAKHWNNGRLTKTQPAKEVKMARRRINALAEFPLIIDYVFQAVIKHKRMPYSEMAQLATDAAGETGYLNKKELRELIRLIVTSVRLRRECTPATEQNAIKAISKMILDISNIL